MDIRFTVNETNYQLTADKYQIMLYEVKTAKEGKNIGSETFNNRKCFANTLQALESIADTQIYESECKTFKDLAIYHKATLDRLNAIADEFSLKE